MNIETIYSQLPERIASNKETIQSMYINYGFIGIPSEATFYELAKEQPEAANEILAVLFPELQETGNAAGAILSLATSLLSSYQQKQSNNAESLSMAYEQIEEQQKTLKTSKILCVVAVVVLLILVVLFFILKR